MALTHGCGAAYEVGETLCSGCFLPLDDPPSNSPLIMVAGPASADPAQPVQRACGTCGRLAPGAQQTCAFCGSPLTAASSSAGAGPAVLELPAGRRVRVDPDTTIVLGREAPNTEVCAALSSCDAVSRRHASLLIAGGVVQVTDLDSVNGTYVNGRRAEPTAVADLDRPVQIGLGQEVTIVLRPGCDR